MFRRVIGSPSAAAAAAAASAGRRVQVGQVACASTLSDREVKLVRYVRALVREKGPNKSKLIFVVLSLRLSTTRLPLVKASVRLQAR